MLKKMLKVIKIGGNVVDNEDKLAAFLDDLSSLEGDKILVHGGGKIATTISKALGIETRMIDGRRVTDERTLDVVTMVYAGLVNKKIVAALQSRGVNAFGLCGADGSFMTSKRREPVGGVDYGFVGDPIRERFSANVASMLLKEGCMPVVAPITHDGHGSLLNTNADTVARTVAVGMASVTEVELVYCFEMAGVMGDINDPSSLIKHIDKESYARLRADGTISGGMIPKIDNAFGAIEQGVGSVVICGCDALKHEDFGGTRITL